MSTQMETRMHIVGALSDLMKDRSLEHIKVTELCRVAGISRTTFYEYFKDTYDVVSWLWDHLMQQCLYKMGSTLTCDEAHVMSFEMLLEYGNFFGNAFKSNDYNAPYCYGSRSVKSAFMVNAQRNLGRDFTRAEVLDIDFYNAGAAAMTRDWVRGGMHETPQEISESFSRCTPLFLKDLLDMTPDKVV